MKNSSRIPDLADRPRRDPPVPPHSPQSAGRRGFTAVEMLIVIGIISILATMAVPAIVPALRKGRVNDAAGAIVQISQQARLLAIKKYAPAGNEHYGVTIIDDPSVSPYALVALILGGPSDGKSGDKDRIVKDPQGRPVAMQKFPSSVMVWTGNQQLAKAAKTVTWYYEYQSGMPIAIIGAGFTSAPVSVGCQGVNLTDVWGITGNDIKAMGVSPGTPTDPGLSVRSADAKVRRAIAIYFSGLAVTEEF
ncbi:MAG: prepilin-type N-terminal cleavage/methylation domain-containing protein [Planctomycetes bacterium]|nr:prepilin-type N-terminal cleavage/methylation domain-containing protein [Planctomycetota bacterium]